MTSYVKLIGTGYNYNFSKECIVCVALDINQECLSLSPKLITDSVFCVQKSESTNIIVLVLHALI